MLRTSRIIWVILITFTFMTSTFPTTVESSGQIQINKIVEVIILENGVYDTENVLEAVGEYAESVKSSLGFKCNIVRLPSIYNNPQKIDEFIQNRYLDGTRIFILVGNDLRWPLSIGYLNDKPVAAPADGVLCDTDGELSVEGDGLHQPITAFTSEASVSYIFPPKRGITSDTQINFVVEAFKKFSRYHQGRLTFEKRGLICGRTDPDPWPIFHEAIERMASASEKIFGTENVSIKEIRNDEIKTYLEEAPAFFGAAGHGAPQSVETSSAGDSLSYADLALSGRAPMLLEIFGCWTSGWQIQDEIDPWCADRGFLSEAAIFENVYNIAMISGNPGPESKSEYSFSNLVLSLIPNHPESTIGELMIGKERRNTDWVLFGDPLLRLDQIGGVYVNQCPSAYIDFIGPSPSKEGANVHFLGHASDVDGEIVGYLWWSSLDGELSRSSSFDTQSLSVGSHTIHFKAQDDCGDWSEEAIGEVIVVASSTIRIISPRDGEMVKGAVIISASINVRNIIAFNFYIDDVYRGFDTTPPYEYHWDTKLYDNGPHIMKVKAYTEKPVVTYSSIPIIVTVKNPLPNVTVISPVEASVVSGICLIDVVADNSDRIDFTRFYVDGIIKGYDFNPPFQWSWDTCYYSIGTHEVHVDAFYRDIKRYIASDIIRVSVNNKHISPEVEILYPSNLEEVSGIITVNVEAREESLLRVYLYLDNNYMGFDETNPYQFILNTEHLDNGPHEMYAVGLYNKRPPHVEIKSKIIQIIVNN